MGGIIRVKFHGAILRGSSLPFPADLIQTGGILHTTAKEMVSARNRNLQKMYRLAVSIVPRVWAKLVARHGTPYLNPGAHI